MGRCAWLSSLKEIKVNAHSWLHTARVFIANKFLNIMISEGHC